MLERAPQHGRPCRHGRAQLHGQEVHRGEHRAVLASSFYEGLPRAHPWQAQQSCVQVADEPVDFAHKLLELLKSPEHHQKIQELAKSYIHKKVA